MAYSRNAFGNAGTVPRLLLRWVVVAVACALLGAAPALAPGQARVAFAAQETPTVSVQGVSAQFLFLGESCELSAVDAGGEEGEAAASKAVAETESALELSRFAPLALNATCDPAAIEVGKDCGMDWMCGIEPCLCGSADHWGGCSCNGLETVKPQVTYASSDEGVVRVVQAFGRLWLVAAGDGVATVTATPDLRYHAGQPVSFTVEVGGFRLADALLAGMIVAAVAICVGIVFAIRGVIGARKRGEKRHG